MTVVLGSEEDVTVVLATARAEASACLDSYRDLLERTTDKAQARAIKAIIEPLASAVELLAQGVARSLGYGHPTPAVSTLAAEPSARHVSTMRWQRPADSLAGSGAHDTES